MSAFVLPLPGRDDLRFDPLAADWVGWWSATLVTGTGPRHLGESADLARRLRLWAVTPDGELNEHGWIVTLGRPHHALYGTRGADGGRVFEVRDDCDFPVRRWTLDGALLARWRAALDAAVQ